MIKIKVAFLENRLFSSKSEFFKNISDCSDGWIKAGPPKKSHFCFDHVSRLSMTTDTAFYKKWHISKSTEVRKMKYASKSSETSYLYLL